MNNTFSKKRSLARVAGMMCMSVVCGSSLFFASSDVDASSVTSDIENLIIKDKCEDLLLGYGDALDNTNLDGMVELFAPDGVWGMEDKLRIEGQGDIREFWTKVFSVERPQTERHDISTIRISATSKKSASGTAYITLYVLDLKNPENNTLLAPQFMVALKVACINTPQGWRFKDVNISPVAATTYRNKKGPTGSEVK